jgi:MinD-like ATPase involved in chromosome partitioning or flagellar assembly
VARTFLDRAVELAGWVPADTVVREAVRHRVPFALYAPDSRAARAMERLGRHVAGVGAASPAPDGGFFGRLSGWLAPGRRGAPP